MGFGGMYLKSMTEEELTSVKLTAGTTALKVAHVGQYAPHDVAKRAGFQKDDILVSFNKRTDLLRESDLLAYALNDIEPGTAVPVEILRGGTKKTLTLTIPDAKSKAN